MGFQHRNEAERFLTELRERSAQFGLERYPEKTRLIEFGRFPTQNRKKSGDKKPETFNFLDFNHICGKSREGKFTVLRQTMRKKWQAKLKELKIEFRHRMHHFIPDQGSYLRSVVSGHMRY